MSTARLLTPGLWDVHPEVREAMAAPQEPHYGQEWAAFYRECQELLRKVFPNEGPVYIMVGSGRGCTRWRMW